MIKIGKYLIIFGILLINFCIFVDSSFAQPTTIKPDNLKPLGRETLDPTAPPEEEDDAFALILNLLDLVLSEMTKEKMEVPVKTEEFRGALSETFDEVTIDDAKLEYKRLKKELEEGEIGIRDLLRELTECNERCGPMLKVLATVYLNSTSDDYRGIVFFNSGKSKLNMVLEGDRSQGGLTLYNEAQLENVLGEWKNNKNWHITLDARASLPGKTEPNDALSEDRVHSVMSWFHEKGVPARKLHFKWLGEYGPLLDENVCGLYGLQNTYKLYVDRNASHDYDESGNRYFDGLNQSVVIFLYDPATRRNVLKE